MRIIFFTSKLNFVTAGASVTELDLLARTLQERGHAVTMVTTFFEANQIPKTPPYAVIEEKIVRRDQLGIQRGIVALLKKYMPQADWFHVDGHLFLYGAGWYRQRGGSVPVAAFFNRELVSWPPNVSSFFPLATESLSRRVKRRLRAAAEKYVCMRAAAGIDLATFTNPYLRQAYEDFGFRRRETDLIFGDPFDAARLMRENGLTEMSYRQRNKRQGPFTLFYSSRMAAGKGFDILAKTFAELQDKNNFRLILGGSGPEEPLVRALVRQLGLERYVQFPGWVTTAELYKNLHTADIFIQARWRTDMTSYSLLTAMAFGLPSILPGGGGLEWDAKESALYFRDGDYVGLARQIEQLAGSFDLRATLSANCYRRLASDELNNAVQTSRLENAMQSLKLASSL